jgi:hypothetical protein
MPSKDDCPVIESLREAATIQPVQDARAEKYGLIQAWSMGLGIPLILLAVTVTGNTLIDGQEVTNAKLAEFNTALQLQNQRMDFFSDKVDDLEKADETIIEKLNIYISKGTPP